VEFELNNTFRIAVVRLRMQPIPPANSVWHFVRSHLSVCLSIMLWLLKALSYKVNFWCAGASSKLSCQVPISRSSGQRRGQKSKISFRYCSWYAIPKRFFAPLTLAKRNYVLLKLRGMTWRDYLLNGNGI